MKDMICAVLRLCASYPLGLCGAHDMCRVQDMCGAHDMCRAQDMCGAQDMSFLSF
jgi:hypothetical protein